MIRYALALMVAGILLGSVALCQLALTRQLDWRLTREVHDAAASDEQAVPSAEFTMVVTPSFEVVPDPFALRTTGEGKDTRILVRMGEQEVMRWTRDVMKGIPIRQSGLSLPQSTVELYVEAAPVRSDAMVPCALRIQIIQGETVYADRTLWSAGDGSRIAQRIQLDLEPQRSRLDRGLSRQGARRIANGDRYS